MISLCRTNFFNVWKTVLAVYLLCIFVTHVATSELDTTTLQYDSLDKNGEYLEEGATVVPYEEAVINETRKFTYHKCFCGIQEIRSGEKCLSEGTDVVIPLLQDLFPESDVLFDFFLSPVQIQTPSCPSPNILIDLKDNLFVLENGELYSEELDMLFPVDKYCFELLEEGNIFRTYAKVCTEIPKIPFCNAKSGQSQSSSLDIYFGNDLIGLSNFDVLEVQDPKCNETFSKLITLPLTKEDEEQVEVKEEGETLSLHFISGSVDLFWQSSLKVNASPKLFGMNEYCLLTPSDDNPLVSVNLCLDDPLIKHQRMCNDSVCVRKCCPQQEIFNTNLGKCLPHDNPLNSSLPPFYDYQNKPLENIPENLLIEYSLPLCPPQDLYIVDPKANPGDDFFLLHNGSLYMSLSKLTVPPSHYCLDSFLDDQETYSFKAISCFLQEVEAKDTCKEVVEILYPILIVISCLFLIIILIVYSVIPELHAKLHGKILVSHVSALLVAFVCQLIVFWGSKSLSMNGCKIIALGNQVSFLWAFFWLNVMCFDIWWTLKSMRVIPETGESSRRRFGLYSMYAWGCPLLIAFITGLMEFLPTRDEKSSLILPGFGARGCWFQDEKSTWIYFHGFTLTLYVMNIFFFIHVAAILIKGQRSTEGILRTTRKQHRKRVYLYLKLFAVMGITWVCEVVSWQEGTCQYWILTDIVNSLQGVLIFFIFMCSRKVFQKLQAKGIPLFKRMKALVRSPSSVEPGDGRTNSSSQRTTQTSDESSTRRLSSSVPPIDNQLIKK